MKLLESLPKTTLTIAQEAVLCRTPRGQLRLVMCNMREAFFYGKSVCQGRLRDDEIFSLCYTALTHSARNYKPNRNRKFFKSRFFGYVKPYIRGEIFRSWGRISIVKNGKCISLPDGLHLVDLDLNEEASFASSETTPIEVATVEPRFDRIDTNERFKAIAPVMMSALSDTEKMVIDLYYRGDFNFEQIGKLLRVSRSAIQNTHSRALRKTRAALLVAGKLTTII